MPSLVAPRTLPYLVFAIGASDEALCAPALPAIAATAVTPAAASKVRRAIMVFLPNYRTGVLSRPGSHRIGANQRRRKRNCRRRFGAAPHNPAVQRAFRTLPAALKVLWPKPGSIRLRPWLASEFIASRLAVR